MRSIVLALAVAVLSITLIGCDENFLTRVPPGELTTESFYQSPDDALLAINAVYQVLGHRPFHRAAWKIGEVPSDDVILFNTTGGEYENFSFNASGTHLQDMWSTCYQGIFRANVVLERVPGIEMDEALKSRYLAEAKFLRAFYYWYLTTMWGDVPFITEVPESPEDAEVPKSPRSEIYALMIQDLQEAAEVLPVAYPDDQAGRATKGAAQALLGKVYLYAENYSEAASWLKEVIDSGTYELLPSFQNVFITDNSRESIFEIQYNVQESSSRKGDLLPRAPGDANMQPVQGLVDEFEGYSGPDPNGIFDGRDPRLFYSVWKEGDPYDEVDPTFHSNWTTTGYAIKKGNAPVQREGEAVRNRPLIRFAGVLLMYAEAANENGHLQEAIEAVNRVRARVNMPPLPTAEYPVSNKQAIFEAIVHERRVELAFEYHRLNDLRRWGLAEGYLGDLGYRAPTHRYYPIPQTELDVNENLEQNPNY